MRAIGFSTGAISLGDFDLALSVLSSEHLSAIELSALRVGELAPLVNAIPRLDLSCYSYISVHAPSSYGVEQEEEIANLLFELSPDWPIILHPDTIFDPSLWRPFGKRIALENMDRRKNCGRTATELQTFFELLPDAMLCFDIGHARQLDASMSEAYLILTAFPERLVQLHVSEVDTQSRHSTMSYAAELAFGDVVRFVESTVPLILESRVAPEEIEEEVRRVRNLFSVSTDRSLASA